MKVFSFIQSTKRVLKVGNIIKEQFMVLNLTRIFYISFLVVFIHLAHLLFFAFHDAFGDPIVESWRIGNIVGHAFMMVFMIIISFCAYMIKKREKYNEKLLLYFTQLVALSYLLFGVIMVTIDQLIKPSNTAFLLVVVFVGIILIIPPILAISNYIIMYVIYYFSVGFTQMTPELLLSVRVSGLTSIGIGIGVAIVLWHNHSLQLTQKHRIEIQNKRLERTNKKLIYYANYDPLTGLYNRMKFMTFVKIELERMKKKDRPLACLLIIDIDQFKRINDNYGHPVGDYVLKKIAAIIQDTVNDIGISARLGGEEFIILLPDKTVDEGVSVAESIRIKLQQATFEVNSLKINCTASFGVAPLLSLGKDSFNISYTAADKALYIAKNSGRNSVMVSTI
ncbi:GGDEF domain-containing protein [Evansella sp. AB-P1]|uniref:GGDEF domain-containing protein n=1 Tax=Evansella sp. AB-P1 TaxID=3037653 RepID=UPI00241C6226|nr:GGDEF domain-containing protein [Evansella sp. AB-P1]MDG5787459.1 GGDEF domain-containing protein [Evansella sp. AB-P1]